MTLPEMFSGARLLTGRCPMIVGLPLLACAPAAAGALCGVVWVPALAGVLLGQVGCAAAMYLAAGVLAGRAGVAAHLRAAGRDGLIVLAWILLTVLASMTGLVAMFVGTLMTLPVMLLAGPSMLIDDRDPVQALREAVGRPYKDLLLLTFVLAGCVLAGACAGQASGALLGDVAWALAGPVSWALLTPLLASMYFHRRAQT